METVIQDLIYRYVRDRQLCTRAVFVQKHPHPVLVFRQAQTSTDPDTTQMPALSAELQAAVRVMRRDAHQYRVFPLRSDHISVGRGADSDLLLADGSVSKAHGHIERSDIGYAVVDHASRNGTRVGEHTLGKTAAPLTDTDVLHFGNVKVTYLTPASLFDFLATLLDPRASPGG